MTVLVAELVEPPTELVTEESGGDRWRTWFAVAMLALALSPIVVSVVRAIVMGWVPIFDAGYFTVRSRDVFTAHHPWLGALSSASFTLGTPIRNLGPLQLDLLAPFTKIEPYGGTAVGVAAVAAASVFAVWWSARRVLGDVGAGAAMVATLVVEATIGSQAFIDPRQQIYLLLPYWALLWLAWATATGQGVAIPPLVFTASLILQTHFTYLFQTLIVVTIGVGIYLFTIRARWQEARATRWLLLGLAVALICWVQPLWDQVAGERNLGAVLANRGASEGVGWGDGTRLITGTVLVPPQFWWPGTMGEFVLPADIVSPTSAWLSVGVWGALLTISAVVASRRGSPQVAMLAVFGGVALTAALVAGAAIPLAVIAYAPQNYFWMWPTAVFMTFALVAAVLVASFTAARRRLSSVASMVVLAAVGLVVALVASRQVDHFSVVANTPTPGDRVAGPALAQLNASLRRLDVSGPVVVDYTRTSLVSYVIWTFLAELQRAEVEFTFPAGNRSVARFGLDRCEEGQADGRIVIADADGDPVVRDGEVVLARVDAFTDEEADELAELDRSFGEWLRGESVTVDLPGLEYLAGRELPELRAVLSSPGHSAIGLAGLLQPWPDWGVVHIPHDLRDDFDRWVDLQTRSAVDDLTILLAPAAPGSGDPRHPVAATACLN
jgi:Ca2+/Na+ antiporter